MIIKKIALKNIRSYEKADIEFPEGSILLAGDIGSGKTSVLMAIEFALFGLQPGQRGTSLLRNGKNDGSVRLEFELEGKKIIIERGLRRGKSVSQSYSSIVVDGEKKEMSVRELKNFVIGILNYPKEFVKKTNLLYKFTVYTPQEGMRQIILENAETRLNTLRHVFGIDKYKKIRENTTLFTIRLREEIRNKEGMIGDVDEKRERIKKKQSLISDIKLRLSKVEKDIALLKDERKKAEKALSDIEKRMDEKREYEKEVEKTRVLLASKKEMFVSLSKEAEQMREMIQKIKKIKLDENEIKRMEEKKAEKEKEKEKLGKQYLEISGKISSLEMKNSDILKLKERILKLQLCPTCLQNVDNEYKKNILVKFGKEMDENNELIKGLLKDRENVDSMIKEISEEISNISSELNKTEMLRLRLEGMKEKEERLAEIEKNKKGITKDMELLDKHLEGLKGQILKLANLDLMYKKRKENFDLCLRKEREAEIKIAELMKEIELTHREIEELNKEIKEKEKIKRHLEYLTELEDWLSNKFLSLIAFTERNVMLKLREEFSKLFNKWFSMLVSDMFVVRLDEDFTPIIEQQDYELDYAYLSGGERTAVALAYRLALNQVINSLLSKIKTRELVILDEPTDGFSEQQLDKMRDVLQQLNVNQLILVSHEQKIEGFVDSVLRFKKESGITRFER